MKTKIKGWVIMKQRRIIPESFAVKESTAWDYLDDAYWDASFYKRYGYRAVPATLTIDEKKRRK